MLFYLCEGGISMRMLIAGEWVDAAGGRVDGMRCQ
jgi:hypothetical protein